MVRGSDFLTKDRLEVIKPELRVGSHGEVFLSTEPVILKWKQLDLVDLQIDNDARFVISLGLTFLTQLCYPL